MRINTNVAAINTHRALTVTNDKLGKALGRLSTGFRINRAADDAAGLGIANQLRATTRALQQATRNAEQANSMLQIMEGAAGKVEAILERMKELATQAASDNVDAQGRARIDEEFQALRQEIDRIVSTTKFQGQALLDGTLGNYLVRALDGDNSVNGVADIKLAGVAAGEYTVQVASTSITLKDSVGNKETITFETADRPTSVTFGQFGVTLELADDFDLEDAEWTFTVEDGQASFMVSSSGNYNGADLISMADVDLRTSTLGLNQIQDLLTTENARNALSVIDGAIDQVNKGLGSIGAAQNRLEFALDNVRTAVENYAAAESTIRDVDFAAEMSEFTKYQILQQAGIAMLSQANTAPQAVLSLLR
ncbi:MAG TPA: flagellin [Longimicrobiales bacterium]|nr:flagellin [Longimicrobiales bacterium]